MTTRSRLTWCSLTLASLLTLRADDGCAASPNPPGPGISPTHAVAQLPERAGITNRPKAALTPQTSALRQLPSCSIALAPHDGSERIDDQIRQAQQKARNSADPRLPLERLGWLYVAKARSSHDPGFHKLAESCAVTLLADDPTSLAGLLLRGHVAQSLHRFKEAEGIARVLIARRELAFDHGLLGDALADQGRLTEAIDAYQRMVDLRPELQSYSRVAHARWLRGDVSGAIEAAGLAAGAGSPDDPEPAAWAFTRLASYEFQGGSTARAASACAAALTLVKDFAPALLWRGRMLLASGRSAEAVECLQRATARSPLPEYQWALAEALRSAGRIQEAISTEQELGRTGASNDPRTFALFLATGGERGELASRLAHAELRERGDVFTHDAIAWALFATGRHAEAWGSMERALAEGTRDGRLFLHAGVIAAALGRADAAERLARARELQHLLLPSERAHLDAACRLPAVQAGALTRPADTRTAVR